LQRPINSVAPSHLDIYTLQPHYVASKRSDDPRIEEQTVANEGIPSEEALPIEKQLAEINLSETPVQSKIPPSPITAPVDVPVADTAPPLVEPAVFRSPISMVETVVQTPLN
jgi:hypothetical protein